MTMEANPQTTEILLHRVSKSQLQGYFKDLRKKIEKEFPLYSTRYAIIGTKVVRILCYDALLDNHISRELACVLLKDEPSGYDYTITAYLRASSPEKTQEHRVLEEGKPPRGIPDVIYGGMTGRIAGYDEADRCFYYGFTSQIPEDLALEGHVFFREFYRILKKTADESLVHGACVGLEGKGVLFCAKGNMGKSTLTVLSLLKGFEYVSDDYLVLRKKDGQLLADPIYSIMTLSPRMHTEMYEELEGTRFLSNNWNKSKYIIDISNLHERFCRDYPIRLCMLPEIVTDPHPSIMPCSQTEKGRAITNMVFSTISQTQDVTDPGTVLKLTGFLKDQEFFKLRLCRDIHENVDYLRAFLSKLS